MKRLSGFSLMEMMIVLLIVAIVAAASAPMVNKKLLSKAGEDSPWVFTNLQNSITYNPESRGTQTASIGAVSPQNGLTPRLFISNNDDNNPQIVLGWNDVVNQNRCFKIRAQDNSFIVTNNETTLNNTVDVENTVLIGRGPVTEIGANSVSIGDMSMRTIGENAVALGFQPAATNTNSIAIGNNATANNSASIAIGLNTLAEGTNSIAIGALPAPGVHTEALTANSIAMGTNARVINRDDTTGGISIGINTLSAGAGIAIGSGAKANETGGEDYAAIALGQNSTATTEGVAIGNSSTAGGTSVAVGGATSATGEGTIAIGYNAQSENARSIAIGTDFINFAAGNMQRNSVRATARDAIAIGTASQATNECATAIGFNAQSTNTSAISIGNGSSATNTNSTALGSGASATGARSIAIGTTDANNNLTQAQAENSIAIGVNAQAINRDDASDSISIGTGTRSAGSGIAIGRGASANETGGEDWAAIAVGQEAVATTEGVAIGNGSNAGDTSVAVGGATTATAAGTIAIGYNARANVVNSVAIGHNAIAKGANSIAFGNSAQAGFDSGVAIGHNAIARDEYNIAIGQGAVANDVNSVAIGCGAKSEYNQIVLGSTHTVIIPGNLEVNGTINGMRYGTSDRRLKNVGKVFKSGLEEIKKLEVFHYTFKDDKKKTPRVGVMAQDLQKIFPDAVIKGEDGFLRIRMEDMFYAIVNAIKELDAKICALIDKQKKIDELEAKVKKLEDINKQNIDRIERLEKMVEKLAG